MKDRLLDIRYSVNHLKDHIYECDDICDDYIQDILDDCDLIEQELTHQPTFSECIKEWEEKGWKVWYKDKNGVDLHKSLLERITIYVPEQSYYSTVTLTFELHNLLTKTLKASEIEE